MRIDGDVVRHRRVQPELLLGARDRDLVRVDDERRHAAGAPRLGIRAREQQHGAAERGVRDPLLRAAHAPPVTVRVRTRDERAGVGARARLGEREAADALAARERRHEPRALLVGAELEQRQRARRRVDRDGDADAGVGARQLLEHEDVRHEVRARAAVLLRHADAHQPQLAELPEQLARKAVVAVPLRRVRLDLRVRELARQRLDLLLLRRQLEVHGGQTIRMRLAAITLAVLALTACGGHKTTSPGRGRARLERRARPERQRGRGTAVRRRRTRDPGRCSDARDPLRRRALECGLPCGGTITLLEPRSNGEVLAVFTLTDRPQHLCDGPGDQAAALFQVKNGKIVLWHEVDVPTFPPAGDARLDR